MVKLHSELYGSTSVHTQAKHFCIYSWFGNVFAFQNTSPALNTWYEYTYKGYNGCCSFMKAAA